MENDVSFHLFEECSVAFNTLKEKLVSTLVLVAPDWNFLFELICDASDYAIGVVLSQHKDKIT